MDLALLLKAAELGVFLLQPLTLAARNALTLPGVDLSLLDPVAHCLARASKIVGDPRGPHAHLGHQPHRALFELN